MGIHPNSWTAVDGLGRVLSTDIHPHSKKKDHYVAMFYWPCHGFWPKIRYHYNISERWDSVDETVRQAAKNDYNHPLWKTPSEAEASWYWDESVFGYYDAFDPYVIRKHAELLADAGVDMIVFDCCVGLKTTQAYNAIFKGFSEARADGVNAPKVCFMFPMANVARCREYLLQVYEEIYSQGLYRDCWFYFENEKGESKPLIFAWNDALDVDDPHEMAVSDFFTYRRPDPFSWRVGDKDDIIPRWDMDMKLRSNGIPDIVGTPEKTMCGWLNTYPQPRYYFRQGEELVLDNMPVGVAQNVDIIKHKPIAMNGTNVAGRSYSVGDYHYTYQTRGQEVYVQSGMERSVLYGLNFQQQWDYAIESDPTFVFVTGWNEWTVGRYPDFCGVKNAFPDQFNKEFSRDCEPSSGELKDYYYYQLVENIRRFKGTGKYVSPAKRRTIDIHGVHEQWDDIAPYEHYVGSTKRRAHNGCIGDYYENDTMRNDICRAKVAYDDDYVFFEVETKEPLTPSSDPAWMRLFISTDLTLKSPNWEGFNYVINRQSPTESGCILERSMGIGINGKDWLWENIGTADYDVRGNILQIQVPRDMLGLKDTPVTLHFKWSDNMQEQGEILDFYRNGDVAPGGRFMFCVKETDQ